MQNLLNYTPTLTLEKDVNNSNIPTKHCLPCNEEFNSNYSYYN